MGYELRKPFAVANVAKIRTTKAERCEGLSHISQVRILHFRTDSLLAEFAVPSLDKL